MQIFSTWSPDQALFRTVRRSADRTFPSSARPISSGPKFDLGESPRFRALSGASSGAMDPVGVRAEVMHACRAFFLDHVHAYMK